MWRLPVVALVLALTAAHSRAQGFSLELVKRPPELVLAGERFALTCRVKNISSAPIDQFHAWSKWPPHLALNDARLMPEVTKLGVGDTADLRLELSAVERGRAVIEILAAGEGVETATDSVPIEVGPALPSLPAWPGPAAAGLEARPVDSGVLVPNQRMRLLFVEGAEPGYGMALIMPRGFEGRDVARVRPLLRAVVQGAGGPEEVLFRLGSPVIKQSAE